MKCVFRLALLIVFLLNTGCFPSFFNGYAVKKEFVPAHIDTATSYYMVGKGLIPSIVVFSVPDKWYITISRGKTGKDTTKIEVLPKTYDSVSVGDKVSLENDYWETKQ